MLVSIHLDVKVHIDLDSITGHQIVKGCRNIEQTDSKFIVDVGGCAFETSTYRSWRVWCSFRKETGYQESDASGLSTPADWRPGEDGVLPPPLTVQEAAARSTAGAPDGYYLSQARAKP